MVTLGLVKDGEDKK